MADLSFFLDLETRVWQALADGDAAADAALLAPEFLGVYSTGFAGRDEHTGQLSQGPTVAAFSLSGARILPLGPGRVLLAYRADYTRVGASVAEAMYVSSIWEERDGTWRNTFSQDSAADAPPPV
ncbi:DUF4440 domain-containing protein [Psychromarinibacter sp. C21-152]|uniref:DUF4440 domain-containing protein n=1 Tax=Psychromarinibacter sediminicola TaxID=3033385 RepID=A0AAE3T6N8_9RHOB|nr:DUF4440 domain-containing protein [Psychromarinibacter sediminicola]MDF0599495.1 DUF4440 domain-containing protein [Psychromarinibacter sediminicola]